MALQSTAFRGDALLEAAAQLDSAHIAPGARGPHVAKIQRALMDLDGVRLTPDSIYGPATAAAVLSYKQKRNIINPAYQTQADNIAGKMTIASLDRELFAKENVPPSPPIPPFPPSPPEPTPPGPHLNLNFILTDPSIYVTVDRPVNSIKIPTRKAIEPGDFLTRGKMTWIDLPEVPGKTALLKIEKKGSIFWILAFVPTGTTASYLMYIFFHPTPVQVHPDKPGGKPIAHIIADDKDYEAFGPLWLKLAQRYLQIIGGQLGAAKKMPLLIPLMRNSAAQNSNVSNDVFADRPGDTLFEILKVLRDKVILPPSEAPVLPLSIDTVALGTASFSSGIAYHANFFNRAKGFGSYLEAIDLDSSYIKSSHTDISQQSSGPTVKRQNQLENLASTPNDVHFPAPRWNGSASNAPSGLDAEGKSMAIATPPDKNHVHHLIAEYTFFGAMKNSLLSP
jgi:peptidoglycan hydrolase-like protein with peptidoglycan-binding domain